MKISYVIITYNKKELLKRILEERLTRLKKGDELIVVDDGSTDGTKEMIKEYPVRYFWSKNKGYRPASMRNKGLAKAKNDCIIQSDDDCLFPDGYVEMLLKHYGKKVLVSGAFERERKGGGRDEDWRNKRVKQYKEIGSNVYELGDVGFSGPVCYSRAFALKIGGYDIDFDGNWGAEDANFGQRWTHFGGVAIFTNKLAAVHLYHVPRVGWAKEQKVNSSLLARKLMDLKKDTNTAIIIHTFLRDDAIYRCVESIKKHLTDYRIYISDAGTMTDEKREFYKNLEAEGHKIFLLYYDTNWTVARNVLVKEVKENYILYLDDDFIVTEETNIEALKEKLKDNVGVVGSAIRAKGKMLDYNFMVEGTPGNIRYISANGHVDIIANCFLAKKKVFSKDRWDENLNIGGGHSDFFLNLKFNTDWKVDYCSDSVVEHMHIGSDNYHEKRRRGEWHQKFLEKWTGGEEFLKVLGKKQSVRKSVERSLSLSDGDIIK